MPPAIVFYTNQTIPVRHDSGVDQPLSQGSCQQLASRLPPSAAVNHAPGYFSWFFSTPMFCHSFEGYNSLPRLTMIDEDRYDLYNYSYVYLILYFLTVSDQYDPDTFILVRSQVQMPFSLCFSFWFFRFYMPKFCEGSEKSTAWPFTFYPPSINTGRRYNSQLLFKNRFLFKRTDKPVAEAVWTKDLWFSWWTLWADAALFFIYTIGSFLCLGGDPYQCPGLPVNQLSISLY